MKKLLFLVMTLVCMSWGQAYADYSFNFAATDTNGMNWDLTGTLQTTIVSGQTYITGGQLTEATGNYVFSGQVFTVLGTSPGNLHGVPNTGGADFTYDNVFNPTSNPVFDSNGIDLVTPAAAAIITTANSVQSATGPFVNIWSNGGAGSYQMQYVGTQGVVPYTITGNFQASVDATPTPIPAAVFLFGSGLFGFFGLKKRKNG
jgi:hypothetical protein